MEMSYLMIRRVLAGIALVALVAAAPAQAAGFGRPAGAPGAWTLAWTWLVRLWGGEVSASQTPRQGTGTVQKQLPADNGSTASSGDQSDPTTGGEKGMGIDPDG
jgi:hypothetical protein